MIRDLIRRARRRYIWNQLLAQGAYAASAGMAGAILLLLAGTQILDWPFLVAISLGALAIGSYRTIRRIPSPYFIAQLVDRRLLLADALSTALAFEEPDKKSCASMREGQRALAERAAQHVNIEQAVPLSMSRAVYVLAALCLVASGLFAVRYGVSRSLDLRAPLARILMENFYPTPAEHAALHRKAPGRPDAPKPDGLTLPEGDPNTPSQLDPAPDSALDTTGIPEAVNDPLPQSQGNAKARSESASTEKADGERGDSASDAADADSGESASDSAQGKQGSQKGPSDNGKPERANAEQNSSLVSKLRDAMSNLLSKMRQQPNGSGSDNPSSGGQRAQQGGAQRAGQKQNGAAGEQPQQAGGQESTDAENEQSGAEGKNGQNSQAKGAGRSSDQQAANQPGSGIGHQDGNKEARLAEQMAAMGKISEIIGKRSANVTGEITIEAPSTQQQLRTPYSQSSAAHADAGGEVSRDEVPVIFQQYVQQYFEQVHKPSTLNPEINTRSKVQAPASKTQPPSL